MYLLKQKGWDWLYTLGITMPFISSQGASSRKEKDHPNFTWGRNFAVPGSDAKAINIFESCQFYFPNEKTGMDVWEEQVKSYFREKKLL